MPEPYRVSIPPAVSLQLHEIFDHIYEQSPQTAGEVVARLLKSIDGLSSMPARFKVVGRSRRHRSVVHARVVETFIVYYRIDEPSSQVFIIDVRRGSRRQPRRFE